MAQTTDNTETASQVFARFLKERREALGVSQVQLAKVLYADESRQSFISSIENGKRKVTLDTASFILQALNSDLTFTQGAAPDWIYKK